MRVFTWYLEREVPNWAISPGLSLTSISDQSGQLSEQPWDGRETVRLESSVQSSLQLQPYLALAGEHEGALDDLLSVHLGVAEMVLAVAVQDLLSLLDGVFGHQIGLSVLQVVKFEIGKHFSLQSSPRLSWLCLASRSDSVGRGWDRRRLQHPPEAVSSLSRSSHRPRRFLQLMKTFNLPRVLPWSG